MAIQMRRGAYSNLDKSKLVAGEIVLAQDTDYVGIAKEPDIVLELAKKDDLDNVVAGTFNVINGCLTYIEGD